MKSIRGLDACEVNCASVFGSCCLYDTILGIVPTRPTFVNWSYLRPSVHCTLYNERKKDPSLSAQFNETQLLSGALYIY